MSEPNTKIRDSYELVFFIVLLVLIRNNETPTLDFSADLLRTKAKQSEEMNCTPFRPDTGISRRA
jgi:hypothetical protein